MRKYLLILLLPLLLAACPTPFDMVRADGTIVHVDYTDNPCGTRGPWAGCSRKGLNGAPNEIWVSGVATDQIVAHELAHNAKPGAEVQHGPWKISRYYGNCATITVGNEKYPVGGLICMNPGKRERIVPPGYDDEDCLECRLPMNPKTGMPL